MNTLTWLGFILDYVLSDRTVSVLTGRPAQIDMATAFLDHVKIPWEVWRLYIQYRYNFMVLFYVDAKFRNIKNISSYTFLLLIYIGQICFSFTYFKYFPRIYVS